MGISFGIVFLAPTILELLPFSMLVYARMYDRWVIPIGMTNYRTGPDRIGPDRTQIVTGPDRTQIMSPTPKLVPQVV